MPYSIMLDAGHGGRDPGAVYNGRQEKDDVLNLVLAIGQILQESGLDVLYTRTTDIYETPFQKATEANEAGVDFFVSIHRNSFPTANTATGVESLVYNDYGIKVEMAENINAQLAELGFRNLGVKVRPNLVVLRRTRMPAVLVEAGFINNNQDNQMFDSMFQEIAQAIADGILETLDIQPATYANSEQISDSDEMNNVPYNNFTPELDFPQEENSSQDSTPQPNINRPQENMPQYPSNRPSPQPGDMQLPPGMPPVSNNNNSDLMPDTEQYPQTMQYHIQVGAFRNDAYANRLLNELLAQDYPAFIGDSAQFYRVHVGNFDDLDQAVEMERRLKRAGYSTVIITE